MNETDEADGGRCWECGYLLRGVESAHCPECGHLFDRSDRTSMNFGRQLGRCGRWAIGRMDRWPIVLGLAGTALVLWTTRWPVEGWRFSLLDLWFYGDIRQWRQRTLGMSAVDAAYTVGLMLSAATVAWVMLRIVLRAMGVVVYRPPMEIRGRFWWRSALLLMLAAVTVAGIGVGWPYRLGQRWAREWEATIQTPATEFDPPLFEAAGKLPPYRAAALRGRTARERRLGMKMVVETWIDRAAGPIFREILNSEKDPGNRVFALRLAGLLSTSELEPLIAARLTDPSREIRIAAADALGIYWHRQLKDAGRFPGDTIPGDPPISLDRMTYFDNQIAPPRAQTRQRVETMMLSGATLDERIAAAQALLNAPAPGDQLRYAEWGVLLGEGPGKIRFTNAILDDVPAFVHRIGNPAAEFERRITVGDPFGGGGMSKPVIHLTVNHPMAVDLEIAMNDGRPWVAYPRFDDLILLNGRFGDTREHNLTDEKLGPRRTIRELDPKGWAPLNDFREGYSWMTPNRRQYPWYGPNRNYNGYTPDPEKLATVAGMGMHWQNLIVTPTPTAFTKPPDVPAEPRFAWWKRLRETPCSWISSRGESERFLYYDGPTIMPSPVVMSLESGELKWTQTDFRRPLGPDSPLSTTTAIADKHIRSALYVEVHGGNVRGFWIDNDYLQGDTSMTVSKQLAAGGKISAADFTARLIKHGLNKAEAGAMVDCWKKTFFETNGRRALVIISQADYEALCPMTVHPWPTEIARVGVVWTEF